MKKNNVLTLKKDKIIEYIAVFFVVFIAFWISSQSNIKNDESTIVTFMLIALFAVGGYIIYLKTNDKLTSKSIVSSIVVAGMIMRIGYMLYTHMFTRAHDLGMFEENGVGHLSYIMNLAKHGTLPQSNSYQFYHPPLFHILAAIFVKIGTVLCGGDFNKGFEFAQVVNGVFSCYMLIAMKNFIAEIDLKEKFQPYVIAIVAFLPSLYLMGGRLNNDMTVTFFMLLCVINTYRWYKKRDMKTIVCLALSFGLGMMCKISGGIMAVFTAPVMIYCLVKDFKVKQYKNIIIQLAVFAVICFPLALWYPIRNYILFEQPLNFVHYLGENSHVYTGDVTWYKRFFDFSLVQLISQPFADMPSDYSIPMHLVRSAVFGEFSFDNKILIYRLLLTANLIMTILSVVSMGFVLVKGTKIEAKNRFGMFAVWVIVIVSFISVNISYPFICTADFRYIPITAVIGAIYCGYAMQVAQDGGRNCVIFSNVIKYTSILFCIFSIAAYM